MNGSVALSSEKLDQIISEDINGHLELMDRFISNAERHGEKSVTRELTRTMEEIMLYQTV